MALTGVLRPGHIAIRVLEMEPALKHYKDVLGLIETARDDKTKRVFLKAWDEHDHHSVVLREADEAGMDYLGWRVDSSATLKRLAGEIEKSALCTDMKWIPAGEHPKTGERFRFTIRQNEDLTFFSRRGIHLTTRPLFLQPTGLPFCSRALRPVTFPGKRIGRKMNA